MEKKVVLAFITTLIMGFAGFAQTISAYEYWIDNDFAGKTTVNIAVGTAFNINTNINTSSLSQGYHTLTFRTRSSDGKWSVPVNRSFVNGNNLLVGIEYWYDNDYSTKSYLAVASGTGGNYSLPLNVSGINIGNHQISICHVDNIGVRSAPLSFSFYYDGSINTGINVAQHAGNGIRLAPNPAQNEVKITGVKDYLQLSVVDVNGRVVLQEKINAESVGLDVRKLTPGFYTIILRKQDSSTSVPFIKN